ncbi:AAA family ATPase [Thermococcus thermotolerans]|uniref:AAA family ATPase n=1 Tax=Thermococcus thermotolerans TaxID=2969672 RepID=UPI0021584FC5|nr:ATP-binding protein [Thermococcus thermotolerans]
MKAPFVYGRKVGREHFADREEEVERLKIAMMSGQNVIIYSPRRYGKSSLVGIALEELGKKVYPIEVDCSGVLTKKELAERISSAAIRTWKGRIEEFLRKLFKTTTPRIIIGKRLSVEFVVGEENTALEEALKLPKRLAEITGKRVVVVFDEFQEVSNLGKEVLPKMRAEFQKHKGVTYVFVGSKQGMMREIFQSPSSPFYNFGMHMILKRIPEGKFKPFIENKFKESGFEIDDELIDSVLRITKGHPHYTQMLCYRLWLNALLSKRGGISGEDLEKALEEILNETAEFFEEMWDSLTINQRRLLVAIARNESDLYSRDFLNRYGFERASTVQAALRALKEKELIVRENGKYLIENPLFELWILKVSEG